MCSSKRSAVACREFGFTAGTFLIMASFVLRAVAQTIEADIPGEEEATTLLLAELPTTSVESMVTRSSLPIESVSTNTMEPPNEDFSIAPSKNISTSMIARDDGLEVSTNPSDRPTGWGHEHEIEIEFIVIIISTVIIVAALVIVVAALVYCCVIKRRNEKQSRFVKFKKSRGKRHKYDKMDVEMGTLPRNEPSGGGWIFSTIDAADENELEPMNLTLQDSKVTNENYDPEVNGNIEIAPSISDYHSETNPGVVPLSLEDDDNDLNVNPMYSLGRSSRGSVKDSGIHVAESDDLADGDMTIRSDNDLQSFGDETVEL